MINSKANDGRLFSSIEDWRQQRFFRWLDRKIPQSDSYRLNLKNLYILPTALGWVFISLLIVLWVLGSNYQNNLVLALCYLLSSLFIVAMHHTHANLSGITVQASNAKPVYAGEEAFFSVQLSSSNKKGHYALQMRWQKGEWAIADIADADAGDEACLVGMRVNQRGLHKPGRLLIESVFPLGLMRCWSWLSFDVQALVYPKPKTVDEIPSLCGLEEESAPTQQTIRGDDFSGLRSYQAGDSLKHIAWKQFAKDKGLYSKDYQQGVSDERSLDWEAFRYLSVEERISALCYLTLHFSQQNLAFSVNIPGHQLLLDRGDAHCEKVLRLLALLPQTVD